MDGASKFVRGDAVAGLLILFINIIGGFAVGMLQHDLSLADAAQNYILLTIGDGLVAQIPSLVLSTAAAIIVTRVSSSQDMGQQFITQLFSNPRALTVTAAIVGALGIVPGMPNLVFITIASIIGGLSLLLRSQQQGHGTAGGTGTGKARARPAECRSQLGRCAAGRHGRARGRLSPDPAGRP